MPDDNGYLFDPADYSDCAMKLVWFAQHPDARARLLGADRRNWQRTIRWKAQLRTWFLP